MLSLGVYCDAINCESSLPTHLKLCWQYIHLLCAKTTFLILGVVCIPAKIMLHTEENKYIHHTVEQWLTLSSGGILHDQTEQYLNSRCNNLSKLSMSSNRAKLLPPTGNTWKQLHPCTAIREKCCDLEAGGGWLCYVTHSQTLHWSGQYD